MVICCMGSDKCVFLFFVFCVCVCVIFFLSLSRISLTCEQKPHLMKASCQGFSKYWSPHQLHVDIVSCFREYPFSLGSKASQKENNHYGGPPLVSHLTQLSRQYGIASCELFQSSTGAGCIRLRNGRHSMALACKSAQGRTTICCTDDSAQNSPADPAGIRLHF